MLLDTWFTNSPFGMPGDEDGGCLSGKTFRVVAKSSRRQNKYIQKAIMNGKQNLALKE